MIKKSKADINKNGKIEGWESARSKAIAKSILQNILDENPDNPDIKNEADYLNGLIQTLGVDWINLW